MTAFVVESSARDGRTGEHAATFRVYVATEARAQQLVADAPPGERSYRAIDGKDMPAAARENLERVIGK